MSHTTSAPATDPAPIPGLLTLPPVSTTHFYHDPVLFDRITVLENNIQLLQGQVKMVELELHHEQRKNNERSKQPSKWQKLNVEAQVVMLREGKQLVAEKDAERKAKEQKKKDAAAQ